MSMVSYFAQAPKGVAPVLAEELATFGATEIAERGAGVAFRGEAQLGYRVCLHSRMASRVLLPIARFRAATPEALYDGIGGINWDEHLSASGSLAVDVALRSADITHSHYATLKVKDAIVDQLRARHGSRPDVATFQPDVRVNVFIDHDDAIVSIDLSGESLHRRDYREESVVAPLKQNLAAAILWRAGWPDIASRGGALVDPLCGSGTFGIEAAMMAAKLAPGLRRGYYGFTRWRQFDAQAWHTLLAEAEAAVQLERLPCIYLSDADARAVSAAKQNIKALDLGKSEQGYRILIKHAALAELQRPPESHGLLICNPPYGERLGKDDPLAGLYAELGQKLREEFCGWQAAVFTGNPELGKHIGIKARRTHTFFNGALECKLLRFDLTAELKPTLKPKDPLAGADQAVTKSAGAQMFANRLTKNLREFERMARKEGTHCYRVYDADMPEYALAIDLYHDVNDQRWVHAQEYAAPASIDEHKARTRWREAVSVLAEVLQVADARIALKRRARQRGVAQYEKLARSGKFIEVQEGAARLLINLTDYLDTGLFLDHRRTRLMIGELVRGLRFLNLFCYTAAASVHAALGGASHTLSVDLSGTYLDWAERNFALNNLAPGNNRLLQADCSQWLEDAVRTGEKFDLIFLDPPTFSNSKRMDGTLDIQRDHVALIEQAARLLAADGVLIFSTNRQKFKLDREPLAGLQIEEITGQTLPPDFARSRMHQCFRITRL